MLFQFHWGYKKDGRSLPEFLAWAGKELKPILVDLLEETEAERVFQPQAVYGYWPAAGAGNEVILFDPGAPEREVARFALPRQDKSNGLCIADFLRDASEPGRDVLGLQVVTIGQRASDVAREWFAADRYNDYVRLHGLGVELAEALAEYVHKRIRAELGFAHSTRATGTSCCARAIAARATPSAIPPAPTSPTSASCWRCSTPRGSGSSCPRRTSSGPSSRPRRSSSTTPRRATSTCRRPGDGFACQAACATAHSGHDRDDRRAL